MKKKIIFRQLLVMILAVLGITGKSQNAQVHHINVIDFNVAKVENEVEISWATGMAEATNYFQVEKSTDGEEFKTVAIVMGPDPTKTACDCYWYLDNISTKTKTVYYRLKHIDTNGGAELSRIKMIMLN